MDVFHNNWLCCYPRPIQVMFDNGSEFKSIFKKICDNLGIKCRPTMTVLCRTRPPRIWPNVS
jgi:hypothetical protein